MARTPRTKNVNAEGFAKAINQILEEYGDDVENVLFKVLPVVAKDAVGKLEMAGESHWTRYNAGWDVSYGKTGKFVMNATVHNVTDYQLTHLLEYSHPMPQGGASTAYKHIYPVNEWVHDEVVKRVEDALNDL